jgi:hypothetical protein
MFTHITMQAQCVSWAIDIHNCSFGIHFGKMLLNEVTDVLRKGWWLTVGVLLVGPVVLTAQGNPSELSLEDLRDCEWLMHRIIKRLKNTRRGRRRIEEGNLVLAALCYVTSTAVTKFWSGH